MARVEMTIDSVRRDLHYEWVVILKEKLAKRYLPIYMGSSQADIIKSLLVGTEPAEPVDYDFSVAEVDTTDAVLKSLVINGFANNIFHAKLLFTHHKKSYEVDCPVAEAGRYRRINVAISTVVMK
jgi:hypothetical protein